MGHAAWVHWTLTGEIGAFYEALRWPGWEDDSGPLAADTGLKVHPPPFTREGRLIAESTKTPTPMAELWSVQQEFVRQYVGD